MDKITNDEVFKTIRKKKTVEQSEEKKSSDDNLRGIAKGYFRRRSKQQNKLGRPILKYFYQIIKDWVVGLLLASNQS